VDLGREEGCAREVHIPLVAQGSTSVLQLVGVAGILRRGGVEVLKEGWARVKKGVIEFTQNMILAKRHFDYILYIPVTDRQTDY
jgi:hypothetical protein